MTWNETRRISLLKERAEDYPLKVTGVQEIGILGSSINVSTDSLVDLDHRQLPGEQFAAKINAKLTISRVKDFLLFEKARPPDRLNQPRYRIALAMFVLPVK